VEGFPSPVFNIHFPPPFDLSLPWSWFLYPVSWSGFPCVHQFFALHISSMPWITPLLSHGDLNALPFSQCDRLVTKYRFIKEDDSPNIFWNVLSYFTSLFCCDKRPPYLLCVILSTDGPNASLFPSRQFTFFTQQGIIDRQPIFVTPPLCVVVCIHSSEAPCLIALLLPKVLGRFESSHANPAREIHSFSICTFTFSIVKSSHPWFNSKVLSSTIFRPLNPTFTRMFFLIILSWFQLFFSWEFCFHRNVPENVPLPLQLSARLRWSPIIPLASMLKSVFLLFVFIY